MAKVEISSPPTSPYGAGQLQLQNKVQMTSTLTPVTDDLNTTSPLKLSTNLVQVVSTLQITTADNPYIDAEDSAGNNRFTIGRDPSSQIVNVDFASNPTGGQNQVGAIRTYTDGVNLAEVMSFRKDGFVGIGTSTPTTNLTIYGGSNTLGITGAVNQAKSIQIARYNSSDPLNHYIGDDGGNFFGNGLTISSSGSNSQLYLQVASSGRNVNIGSAGSATPNIGARLGVRGSGSTSATTSLLVQKSSGDTIFQVQDDGSCTFGQSGSGSTATFYGNTGLQCRIGNSYFESPPSIIRVSGGQLTFWNQNNNANGFSFEHNNSQQTNASGVSMVNIGGGYYTQQSAQFSSLQITPTYDLNANTTTNSIARGIYYNPTITNLRVAQHRAYENTTGDVLLNTTSGNTLIGSGASNTSKLSIKGSGSTSATTSLWVYNSSGNEMFRLRDDQIQIFTGYGCYFNHPTYNGSLRIENIGNFQQKITGAYGENITWGAGGNSININASQVVCSSSFYAGNLNLYPNAAYQGGTIQIYNFSGNNVGTQYGLTIASSYTNNGAGGPNYGKQVRFYDNLNPNNIGMDMTFAYVNPTINYQGTSYGTIVGYDFNPTITAVTANTAIRAFQSSIGGVYINTTSYNASAILQADSTTQGFLKPRMTDAQIRAIVSPAIGLEAYNTDLDCPVFYSAAGWRKVSHSVM